MTPERWREIERLYHAALERDADERAAFLADACGGDQALRGEVESLLDHQARAGAFIETPAVQGRLASAVRRLEQSSVPGRFVGRTFGSYEVKALIAAGGMGEVYRAVDTRLNRTVAIKTLPEHLAKDPEHRERFKREARIISSLNHPNICTLYDVGTQDDIHYLVMEHIDGETLQRRLERGPLPLAHALEYAIQIVDALDKAHRRGVIHRDLKPGNVMLTKSGVKVLDFGLATRYTPAAGLAFDDLTHDHSKQLTAAGTILGTLQYISPEQLEGKQADVRTDIFAFGAVAYEMITGRKAFPATNQAQLVGAILKGDPQPIVELVPDIPPPLAQALSRCLAKDPDERWQTANDLHYQLRSIASFPAALDAREQSRPNERVFWLSALVVVSLIAVVATVLVRRPVPSASEMRVEITTPPTTDPVSLAISPDGRTIVFAATSEGRPQLWLRTLGSGLARPLAGTDGASLPFWSPDGGSLGFFADSKLKRIDIEGRTIQTLANAQSGRGGAWSRDGTIIFSVAQGSPLFRISAAGGEPAALTRLEGLQYGHSAPQFLPDGRHFIYYVRGGLDAQGVYVSQLDGAEPRRLFAADSAAVYSSSRHLLFVRQGTLFGQSFDPDRLELAGNPFPVAEGITVDVGAGMVALSTSAGGAIVYRSGSVGALRQLAWFDQSGKQIQQVGVPGNAERMQNPSLSFDGRHVVMYRRVDGNVDVWLLEVGRGVLSRLTFDEADDVFPTWSPDDVHVVFSSNRKDRVHDLYQTSIAGAGREELLLTTPQIKHPTDWSGDGRFVLYRSQDPKMGWDIWAVPVDGDRKPFPVVQTNFDERDGQFSPDGKWIAYQSNESGRVEIHVQPFPGPGAKTTISTNGGAQVRWRRDGKQLFYIALDGRLMAVPIRLGQSVEAGEPVALFDTHVGGAVQANLRQQYMVSPDGQRFLMNTFPDEAPASPITVILNWAGAPKK